MHHAIVPIVAITNFNRQKQSGSNRKALLLQREYVFNKGRLR
jgi:hypothetical protein